MAPLELTKIGENIEVVESDASNEYKKVIEKLLTLGFKKIGNSGYLEKEGFTLFLEKNGKLTLFVDYNDIPGDYLSIQRGSQFPGFSLIFSKNYNSRVINFESAINGSGSPVKKSESDTQDSSSLPKTIEEQLLEAGFEKEEFEEKDNEQEKNIFTINVSENKKTYKIAAIVRGGKLEKLLKPIPDDITEHISVGTEIVDFQKKDDPYGDGSLYVLKLSNDRMEFGVSTRYGGRVENGSIVLRRELTPKEVGVLPIEIKKEASGFKIGGQNSTELIKNLREINGQKIEDLENRMKPKKFSTSGFLGEDEKLLDVLAADNDFVSSLGLTHQDLAEPLNYVRGIINKGLGREFKYKNDSYPLDLYYFSGPQKSPFEDKTEASIDVKVINLTTGHNIKFSLLLTDMIERYGFYEGKGTAYRLDPVDIIKVFPYLKEKSK